MFIIHVFNRLKYRITIFFKLFVLCVACCAKDNAMSLLRRLQEIDCKSILASRNSSLQHSLSFCRRREKLERTMLLWSTWPKRNSFFPDLFRQTHHGRRLLTGDSPVFCEPMDETIGESYGKNKKSGKSHPRPAPHLTIDLFISKTKRQKYKGQVPPLNGWLLCFGGERRWRETRRSAPSCA